MNKPIDEIYPNTSNVRGRVIDVELLLDEYLKLHGGEWYWMGKPLPWLNTEY